MFDSIKVYLKQDLDIDRLMERLVDFGYTRVTNVAEQGDFAVRGGVVDIYPVSFECPIRIELGDSSVVRIANFDPTSGKTLLAHKIVIVLPIKGVRHRKIKGSELKLSGEVPIQGFVDIDMDEYVVHVDHGIGIYKGIQKLKVEKKYVDHVVIKYAEDTTLYVPYFDLHKIQKYIGISGGAPKVYKLGAKVWGRMKERAKRGVANIAHELLELQAKRELLGGFAFSGDTDWQKEVEEGFPFEETPDQLRSTDEVKKDMESAKPMDRLLCGDVGYGKTEVALRAAFKAVMDNKQVAILVPTTILAGQHYNTFTKRLGDYPVCIEMLSRFRTRAEQEIIVEQIDSGQVDIVIGTHRLFSPDIKFKDLGLVIIDEEQRFGVKHKEKLKRLRLLTDVLTLTATPIPRTLYMALMGGKDMSIIETPPQKRQPVQTHVVEHDDSLIQEAIQREMRRRGQVYFIHNRVRGIENIARKVASLAPGARVAVGHGQMPEKALEQTMLKFIRGQIDVLVCTTIVESGIDIPNANTIIINRADTFGVADLYQLRGRVGRFDRRAYAYMVVPKKFILTQDAQKRLTSIVKHAELGAGFKIAMEDLRIRGAGNLLGKEQHGYITAVGFDLYCRLLKEAIATLSGKTR